MALFEFHIHNHVDLEEVTKKIDHILTHQHEIMATIADLTAKVDALETALNAEQEQIKEAIEGLQATIDELRANEAANGTPEERQALADKLDAIKTDLEGTIADTPPTP